MHGSFFLDIFRQQLISSVLKQFDAIQNCGIHNLNGKEYSADLIASCSATERYMGHELITGVLDS